MQRSLTKGPITGSILLFALPLMLAYLLSATPMGVTGIWLSVPVGWALADAIGIGYYLKKEAVTAGGEKKMVDHIRIRGARVHNLKNVNVDVPLGKIVGCGGCVRFGQVQPCAGRALRRRLPPVSGRTFHLYAPPHDAGGKGIGGRSAVCSGCTGTASAARCAGIRSTFGTGTELLNSLRLMFSRLSSYPCPQCGHWLNPALPWRQKSRCSARSAVPACARFPLKNLPSTVRVPAAPAAVPAW